MKNKLRGIGLIGLLAFAGLAMHAQTVTNDPGTAPPAAAVTNAAAPTLLEGIETIAKSIGGAGPLTNLVVAPYGSYGKSDDGKARFGGGTMLLWNVTPNIGAGMGIDYFGGELTSVSGNFQFKVPTKPLAFLGGNFFTNQVVMPFVMAGIATPLGNNTVQAGGIESIVGGGAETHIATVAGADIGVWGAGLNWQGAGEMSGWRYYLGLVVSKSF